MSQVPGRDPRAWDPASFAWGTNLELYRCCLLRNLFSYPGRSAEQGGGLARPDLATSYPDVSPDGLTWTVHLRQGIHYAPPYEDLTVTMHDVVNGLEHLVAFEREAPRLGGFSPYFSVIEGFDRYISGRARAIVGLDTPDDLTLVIRLTEPAGDLVDRLALSPAAPIPPGVADAHATDYVRYLAALGPYMFEGAGTSEPSAPAEMLPIPGWSPSTVTLVRNPSWHSASDTLRAAIPDRIELVNRHPTEGQLRRMYLRGHSMWLSITPQNLRMLRNGSLPGRVVTYRQAWLMYLAMNVAVPPFDDVHVRRAVNLALDRTAILRDTRSEGGLWRPTWHILPQTLVDFRFSEGWMPAWAPPEAVGGDLDAARFEMSLSHYDTNDDGRCDGSACRVRAFAYSGGDFQSGDRIARELHQLGLSLDLLTGSDLTKRGLVSPRDRIGAVLQVDWQADFSNASTFFLPLLYGPSIREEGNSAFSLLGVDHRQLRRWGYGARSVPSIDHRIERCMTMIGAAQQQCWTELDRYVSEEVVPWAPLLVGEFSRIVSNGVASFDYDAAFGLPAFDRIALAPDAG